MLSDKLQATAEHIRALGAQDVTPRPLQDDGYQRAMLWLAGLLIAVILIILALCVWPYLYEQMVLRS